MSHLKTGRIMMDAAHNMENTYIPREDKCDDKLKTTRKKSVQIMNRLQSI
jgi:hypothetical protein